MTRHGLLLSLESDFRLLEGFLQQSALRSSSGETSNALSSLSSKSESTARNSKLSCDSSTAAAGEKPSCEGTFDLRRETMPAATIISDDVRAIYAPMVPAFRAAIVGIVDPVVAFWKLEELFGDWFANEACPRLKIDDGACIVDALVLCAEAAWAARVA